ncbi:MAG: Holliday junction branch migration protein RuvA [Gemmatimonadetes bacterium]|nr:Holliday junction branch migration protein RuvA [Gemmatimonadota bacterium]
MPLHVPVISRLRGQLLSRNADGRVEVETPGGVVYEVAVPLTVLKRIPAPGSAVELRTVQIVREDALDLYGFMEEGERELFRRLMSVSGIGPKLALQLLSTYSGHRLARALAEKDVGALQQVSGVGRKTAERLVLELSDKVADLAVGGVEIATGPAAPMAQEAVAALVALGYTFTDADGAVRWVLENGGAGSAEELIRKALQGR